MTLTTRAEAQGLQGFSGARTQEMPRVSTTVPKQLQRAVSGYGAQDVQPLVPYTALAAIFNALFAAVVLAARRTKRPLPERLAPRDVILLGIATHKLSRIISRDQVTAFLRAPFVTYRSPAAASEVEEEPRGTGWQRALGNLLTCPYCVAQWVSAGFLYGLLFAPRATRLVADAFAVYTLAEFLGLAYEEAVKIVHAPPAGQRPEEHAS